MTIRPTRFLLAAALAGALAFAGCDEEENAGSPDAKMDPAERHDDKTPAGGAVRPGDAARPGEMGHPAGADGHADGMKQPDNTAHNKGDATDAAKTPFDQAENAADIKITADLRKAILGMDGMSTNADNVKIMTANGVVAVRGVVESQSEIDAITKLVKEMAGVTSSDVQLTVDPN